MKLVELKNCTDKRISIMQVGLRLNPGQTTRVAPSTVSHPAVSPYVGKGLNIVPGKSKEVVVSDSEKKVEPIAPAAEPKVEELKVVEPPKVEEPKVEEPKVEEPPKVVETPVNPAEETPAAEPEVNEADGKSLRAAFVEAPGITDENVDKIMGAYPTIEELAKASKADLVELGMSKSHAKKLRDWANQE